ncbi:hypothetical protein NW754_001558 [Fusarium falciforme]|nr:hypothetical protein NW754_001558 [Fusarium falciforme]
MFGYIRYSWRWLKSKLMLCMLLVLICSACTIVLGLVEGAFLGQWFLQRSHDTAKFLVQDAVSAKAYSWLSVPGRASFLDAIIRPYYIQQLRNPTNWVEKLGLKRPTNWDADRLEQLASLSDLYRRQRHSFTPTWHHWIYASAQSKPMEGDIDEWDKAFNELLQYRDNRFEQMRSVTGNLSFWTSQEPYSEALQFFRQTKRLYSSMATLHPRTYGTLVKIEKYYLELLGLSESQALGRIQLISTGVSALSTIAAARAWKLVHTIWGALLGDKAKKGSKVVADGSQLVTEPASMDPVAGMLQEFLDKLTEEQEKSLMEDPTGSHILRKIRTALDEKNFNSKDEVLGGIMNALGKDPDGKAKHSK